MNRTARYLELALRVSQAVHPPAQLFLGRPTRQLSSSLATYNTLPPPSSPLSPAKSHSLQETQSTNSQHLSRPRLIRNITSHLYWRLFSIAIRTFFAVHLCLQYLVEPRVTVGSSMLPTVGVTETCVLQSRLHRRGRGVRVGDLVSCMHPTDPEGLTLKRVIGMPGDFVVVDPLVVDELGEVMMLEVPEGHCYLMGDNLPHSIDSRTHGPIPLALIRAKMLFKFTVWPPSIGWPDGLHSVPNSER